ncbi:DUF6705 family protein [Pedobacter duraquae]|uniref:DUF6705 domain-containing protein n=1 Tax=Pedobacter duraquae TaxID=425511 RepID=A0A4V3C375_9SPHI|nr:DUF6705 family protein [Pedobacter duraquae]TDO20959.1 hypothetical protein CLV32_3596 [Pedobacter duraquae]
MKNIYKQLGVILICLFSLTSSFAQTKITDKALSKLKPGEYAFSSKMEAFEGAWAFKNDSISFELSLNVKRKIPLGKNNSTIYYDRLDGQYTYEKNGIVINSSTEFPLIGALAGINGPLPMTLTFHDIERKKEGEVTLVITKNNDLEWTLVERKVEWKENYPGFSVPTKMTLSKVR